MRAYEGPATIITTDGTEYAADVSLSVHISGGLKSWDGYATVEAADALILAVALGNQRLRLPNGKEGLIVVTSGSAGSDEVSIVGSGPPPF